MSDVGIAELKARLSEHLRSVRSVRNGGTLTVLDRGTPIARIVPYAVQPLEIRKAKRRPRDLKRYPSPRSAPTVSPSSLRIGAAGDRVH